MLCVLTITDHTETGFGHLNISYHVSNKSTNRKHRSCFAPSSQDGYAEDRGIYRRNKNKCEQKKSTFYNKFSNK